MLLIPTALSSSILKSGHGTLRWGSSHWARRSERQGRLYLQERKLTLFHVIYSPADRIESVTVEKLSGAPDTLPAVGSEHQVNTAQ